MVMMVMRPVFLLIAFLLVTCGVCGAMGTTTAAALTKSNETTKATLPATSTAEVVTHPCRKTCDAGFCRKEEECHCTSDTIFFCGSTTTGITTTTTVSECERRCAMLCVPPRPANCHCTESGHTQCYEDTPKPAATTTKPATTLKANACERSCDVGNGKGQQTCEQILASEDNEYDCDQLASWGCPQCRGCDKCDRKPTVTNAPTVPTQISPANPKINPKINPKQYFVSGDDETENTWTKMPGMRCARDNRDHFWWAEWWYNSIIRHDYGNMEECQKDCEQNPYCNACDHWPTRAKPGQYGEYRSFFLCDLRDGAPCEGNQCSHVMLLDRKDKNWVVKARQCSTKETCGYTEKMARGMHYDWYFLYQGGMVTLTPDSEEETYTCRRHHLQPEAVMGVGNALIPGNSYVPTTPTTTIKNTPSKIFEPGNMGPCVEWDSKEIDVWRFGEKYRESESGRCFCFYQESIAPWVRVPMNAYFCVQWSCSQTETSVRVYGSTTYGDRRRRSYHDHSYYRSYYAYYTGVTSDQEITNCACTLESANGKFCQEWQCVENVDMASEEKHLSHDDFDELETERYVCTDTEIKGTLKGNYCMAWTGSIVGRHEFELTDCRVTRQYNGNFYPTSWSCLEDGYHFWQRSWVGVVLACILMVFGLFVIVGKSGGDEPMTFLIIECIFFVIATLISTMCAGIVGFIVVLSVFVAVVVFLVVCIMKNR